MSRPTSPLLAIAVAMLIATAAVGWIVHAPVDWTPAVLAWCLISVCVALVALSH